MNLSVWTPERVEFARQRWVELRWTASSIAAALDCGLTRNAVVGKMDRLGYRGGRVRPPPRIRTGRRIKPRAKYVTPAQEPALNVTVEELPVRGACRYPAGGGPFTFCGAKTVDLRSYCAYHFALCHYGHRSNTQQQRPASTDAGAPPPMTPPDLAGVPISSCEIS